MEPVNPEPSPPPDSFRRFRETVRALLAVPKKELDDELAAWKTRRAKKIAAGAGVSDQPSPRRKSR